MADRSITGKKKILYVEILRIIAIVFVIFNHTHKAGYIYFTQCDPAGFSYWFCMFFSVFCKFSVPMFFMISGMMLLGKDETVTLVWKKRILKYAVILLIISVWDYFCDAAVNGKVISVREFFTLLFSKGVIEPLWFMYAYIAFLIMLPFLRKMAQYVTAREFNYLVILQIVFGALDIFGFFAFKGEVSFNGVPVPANLLNITVFYPLIGYYLGNKLKEATNKMLLTSFAAFFAAMALTMAVTDYRIRLTGEMTPDKVETFYMSLISLEVIFMFLLARRLFENKTFAKPVQTILIMLGGSIFGIYLLENTLRECFSGTLEFLKTKINTFLSAWIFVFMVFAACALIVVLFNYVKGFFKKLTTKTGEKTS